MATCQEVPYKCGLAVILCLSDRTKKGPLVLTHNDAEPAKGGVSPTRQFLCTWVVVVGFLLFISDGDISQTAGATFGLSCKNQLHGAEALCSMLIQEIEKPAKATERTSGLGRCSTNGEEKAADKQACLSDKQTHSTYMYIYI